MMEGGIRWCPQCMLQGERKRLRLLQISDNFAAHLCENEKCVNLGEVSSTCISTLILQRKSSEIPNTKKKKTGQDPAVGSVSKQTHLSSYRVHDSSSSTPASSQKATSSLDSKTQRLLLVQVSSKTVPQVRLWENKSALCWLDACMCVLVSCGGLRECLAKLPGQSSIRTLCTVFIKSQSSLKMPFCPDTEVHVHSPSGGPIMGISNIEKQSREDCILTNSKNAAVPCDGLPVGRKLPPVTSDIPERKHSPNVGTTCGIPPMQQVPTKTLRGTENNLPDSIGMKTSEPLDNIRNALFQQLKPLLKCEVGQEESPLLALPLLLRLDRRLEEHFMSRYHMEFCCAVCQYTQVDVNKKTVPTITRVPADFSMASPVNLQKCPQCNSQDQSSQLVFHSLPACMMMHFQEGLPDSDLSRHHTFTIRGATYTLSSVIQYCRDPNHFVTYIRDCEANYWLKYDDLLPSPFLWQLNPPGIPASEIHIMVWERVAVPCTACAEFAEINDDVTHTQCTPIRTAAPCSQEQKLDWKSQPNRIVHCKQDGLAWLATSARNSRDSSSAGGKPVQTDVVDKLAVSVIDLTGETEDSTAMVVELEEQSTGFNAECGPECSKPGALALSASKISACRLRDGHTKQMTSEQPQNVTTQKPEPVQQSCKPEPNHKKQCTNVTRRPRSYEEPTFLKKLNARRKTNIDKASSLEERCVASILDKIPEQLMNLKTTSTKNSMPSKGKHILTDSTRGKIPQPSQLNQHKLVALHNPSKESNSKVVRPILTGTQTKAPGKQVKFQPYGYTSEHKRAAYRSNDQLNAEGSLGTPNALSSWQRRVGMYTSSVRNPRKRARQDSADVDNPDLPVHHGPPCSSVSSPSACSDISSVSDNQAFVSGKDDLAAAIDELYKVLDVSSEYTPSVSSRLSSPSQDMFLSELLDGEAVSGGMEEKYENTVPFNGTTGQMLSKHSFDDASVTLTASSSETLSTHMYPTHTQSSISSQHNINNNVAAPHPEGFHLTGELQHCDLPHANADIFKEGTLYAFREKNQVLQPVLTQLAHSDSVLPVSSSQGRDANVTPLNDYMIRGVEVNSFTNSSEGKNLMMSTILGSNDVHVHVAPPLLCDDIQEVLNSEWNDHFVEMFST